MLFALALLTFCVAACLFALAKGGATERLGAGVILANIILATTNYQTLDNPIIDLTLDGATAALLLLMALRYASVWLGAVMLIYALQFSLHAFYFVAERPIDPLHRWVNNTNSVLITICLASGTVVAWRRRLRERRAASAAAASA